jgi:hypothetical protein
MMMPNGYRMISTLCLLALALAGSATAELPRAGAERTALQPPTPDMVDRDLFIALGLGYSVVSRSLLP